MFLKSNQNLKWNILIIGLNLIGLGPYYLLTAKVLVKFLSFLMAVIIVLLFIILIGWYGILLIKFYHFEPFVCFQKLLFAFLLYLYFLLTVPKKWNKLMAIWNPPHSEHKLRRVYEIYLIFLIDLGNQCFAFKYVIQLVFEESPQAFQSNAYENLPYRPTLGIISLLFFLIVITAYSLINAFLILLLTKFDSKLANFNTMIDRHINKSNGIYAEYNNYVQANIERHWTFIRKEYNKLYDLFDALNDFCSLTIFFYLLAPVMNIFIATLAIISDIDNPLKSNKDKYIILICEILRIRAILITASDIPGSQKKTAWALYKITLPEYNMESSHLLKQVFLNKMSIKIAGIFEATREFFPNFLEYMLSYTIIVIQLIPHLKYSFNFTDEDGEKFLIHKEQ